MKRNDFGSIPFEQKRIYVLKMRFDKYYYNAFKTFVEQIDPEWFNKRSRWDTTVDWHPWDEIKDEYDLRKFNFNKENYISSGGVFELTYYLNLKTGILIASNYAKDIWYKYNSETNTFDKYKIHQEEWTFIKNGDKWDEYKYGELNK